MPGAAEAGMGAPITPLVYLLPVLVGLVGYIAVNHIWLWLGRREEPLHLWVASWCVVSVGFLASHYIQIVADDPGRAMLGSILSWTAGLALPPVVIGLGHALVGRRTPRRVMLPAVGVTGVLLLALWTTDAFITRQHHVRIDLLGHRETAFVPGRFMPLFILYIAVTLVILYRMLSRPTPALGPEEQRGIRLGFLIYGAAAANDVLHAAEVVQSVRLFDLGFVAVALGLTYMLTRRYNLLHARLEEGVAARTSELALALEAEGRARREAEEALDQVQQLHGLLPICAYCKRIRNDRNYWQQIETYIAERSKATFSHGICPECRSTVVARELEDWRREGG